MRITKKYLNKLVYIEWLDVWSSLRTTVRQAIDRGFYNYKTTGWVVHVGKHCIIIATERATDTDNKDQCDITYLHKSLIKNIKLLNPSKKS